MQRMTEFGMFFLLSSTCSKGFIIYKVDRMRGVWTVVFFDSFVVEDDSFLFHPPDLRPLPRLQSRRSMAACHLWFTMMQSISWLTCDLVQLCFALAPWIYWSLLVKLICSVKIVYSALILNFIQLRCTFTSLISVNLLLQFSLEIWSQPPLK